MLSSWILLAAGCPGPTPPPPVPTPVTMHCVDDKEDFGLGDNVVLIDTAKVKAQLLASMAQKPEVAAAPVETGNCDTKLGVDVMARSELTSMFETHSNYRGWEAISARMRETQAIELPLAVGAAGSTSPGVASKKRLATLRSVLGLDGLTVTGKGVGVAVVDAGIDAHNPAFAGALAPDQWCLGDGACAGANACVGPACGACEAPNECQHGSATTSLIAGRAPTAAADAAKANALWFAPGARAQVVRVLYQGEHAGEGSVNPRGDTARIARAIRKILTDTTAADVPVIYLGFTLDESTSATVCGAAGQFANVVGQLAAQRIVVAPAGNEGGDAVLAPACFPGVISVAASGRTQDAAHDENPTVIAGWSSGKKGASILAPGEDLPVAAPLVYGDAPPLSTSDYTWSTGTSMAAASVAGAMALAVEAIGPTALIAKSPAERVKCIADTTSTPPHLQLGALGGCH
jgi:subtilisin family serine protease